MARLLVTQFFQANVYVSVLIFSVLPLWGRGQSKETGPTVVVRTSQNRSHYYSTTTENDESDKLLIGHETVQPGVEFYFGGVIIYAGGLRDTVYPSLGDLQRGKTVLHLEARANWSTQSAFELPPSAIRKGFVAYLDITAEIVNQATGLRNKVALTPHINLENNLHYARNVNFPGSYTDLYTIKFIINSPVGASSLLIEKDWKLRYGLRLLKKTIFLYRNVAFAKIDS